MELKRAVAEREWGGPGLRKLNVEGRNRTFGDAAVPVVLVVGRDDSLSRLFGRHVLSLDKEAKGPSKQAHVSASTRSERQIHKKNTKISTCVLLKDAYSDT